MRQLWFGAGGRQGVSGLVLSLSVLRVSRAVVVACTNCREGEGTRTRTCQMFNDARAVQDRRRNGAAQATEIAFGSGFAALRR